MNDNKIITTEDGEEINLTALEREFGSYKFEGKTYYAAVSYTHLPGALSEARHHVGGVRRGGAVYAFRQHFASCIARCV